MKRLFIYASLFILSLNVTSLNSYTTESIYESYPVGVNEYNSQSTCLNALSTFQDPLQHYSHGESSCSPAPDGYLLIPEYRKDYYILGEQCSSWTSIGYYTGWLIEKQVDRYNVCRYDCIIKTDQQCKIEMNNEDAFFDPNTCSCMIPCTLPQNAQTIKTYDGPDAVQMCMDDKALLSHAYPDAFCKLCPTQDGYSGGLYTYDGTECTQASSDKLFIDVDASNCNSEYFEYSQPVSHGQYSPWYYGNFEYDSCMQLCLYEAVQCPKNTAYGWDERECVVPKDPQEDCTGDFYCINSSISDEYGQGECTRRCYCDSNLVSETSISCSDPEDTNTTNPNDNNSTTNPDDQNNDDIEDDTPIEDNNSTNPDAPADCTVNQVYNYDTQKCVDIEVDDTNNTNPINSDDDNNSTNTPSDTNSTYDPLDGIRQDLNTTNSILNSILQAIRDNNSSSSSSTGSAGTGESNTTQENNDTSENNESGSTMGDVEDMVKGIYNKKYSVFATECGAPTFDSSVVFMGNVIENPMIITHEKISPFISEIRVFVILSATLMGLLMIFRR